MSIKTANYVTKEEYVFLDKSLNKIIIPEGTFVKPLDFYYVPKHVRDRQENYWYNPNVETFVYCSYGILLIPKKLIREV